MEPLTEKQQKLLSFIEDCLKDGCPPSQREIAQHFHLTQNAVYQLLWYLKRKGYLTDSGGHRGIRMSEVYLRMQKETEGIPVIGRVAAGTPILAEENIEGYIDLKELFHLSKDTFILNVVGDSMVNEGITDGDYVVVKPTTTIENGQIGVVLIDDEATIKRIYVERNRLALKPANQAAGYKTRFIKRGDKSVRIIGRVTGCFKIL
jgi:repressor LexA